MWFLLLAFLAQAPDFEAEGLKALDAQKYDEAVTLLSKAVVAEPKDYTVHFNLGLAYSLLNKDAEAIAEYKTVLELKPRLYEAQLNLGISLLTSKDSAGAAEQLQDAAAQKPQEFRPKFYLAEAQFALGKFGEAEGSYKSALELNQKSAAAEVGLGRSVASQSHLAEAEPHYRNAVALDGSYKDMLLELGTLYEDKHQASEAIAIFREFPDNPGAQERLGALLLESGRAADAIPPLEFSVAKSPTSANRLALAQAYVQVKQAAKAEPLAAQVVEAAPSDVPLRLFYARLLRDQRKFPQAAAQFLAAAQKKPDSVEAWTELSGIYMAAEQYPEALAALDRVRSLGAETYAHAFIRALAYDHLHQAKEALENYNKFLAASHGDHPDQEFQARQRARTLERELGKR